jgi:hypothetical protein
MGYNLGAMDTLPLDLLHQYRAQTFNLSPETRLQQQEQAIAFVNRRGFVYFWPINGIVMPNLWVAAAGNRPVADAHDDPGHVTWGWKDSLLGGRQWYYAKILRKKATMIAMPVAPYFYALSENYGAYDEDYLTQYEQGRLTLEAKTVYETLLSEGALDTVALRRATHMAGPASDSRFARALSDLQADFKITPVAVTQAGAWHYAFAYDVTGRHYPELAEQAHAIGEAQARDKLAELYFRSVGAAQPGDVTKLFGWRPDETTRTIESLAQAGVLQQGVRIESMLGEYCVIADLG